MKPGQDDKRRGHVCWNKDAHPQCLRVELADGSFYVFPYSRLQWARYEPGTAQDELHLLLDTHEVRITGKNLRDLDMTFQKLAVDWVRELAARYGATANEDTGYIFNIKISQIQGL